MLNIAQKGMLTTVQDLGRRGWQRFGVPVSGAMDWFAASLANILAGNSVNAPLLEATILGPVIDITQDCAFAVTGGVFNFKLNGEVMPMNTCIRARAGSRLELGFVTQGARGYIAFSGGIDIDMDMGSASTYSKAGLGGIDGRPLRNGDILVLRGIEPPKNLSERFVEADFMPPYSTSPTVRIVTEARSDYFAGDAITALTSGKYTLLSDSDRMGCRLEGNRIPYAEGCDGNILSDGAVLGSIQVAGGRPIILMADRQTTGGYTKIGAVIMADIPLVAQLKPSDSLTFTAVSLAAAQEAYGNMRTRLYELDRRLLVVRSH